MILVDEGHHNVAPSWAKVFERFPRAKVISLTATPFRSDGVRPVGEVIYRYPFFEAMMNGYIKNVHSRNVAPEEIYFNYRDDNYHHTLNEVLELKEEAWFRKGVALSKECNSHIVDASIKYLTEIRDRTGFFHQLIAVACSVDHARQIRSLYAERGLKTKEIYSAMDKADQSVVMEQLKRNKLDCIVQVQMLGEGFDRPPLSVAAIFRPYRSLSPYIQFIGRVLRVIHQNHPQHPDNHAYLISHVGLNNDEHWNDFRELDFNDQQMIRKWVEGDSYDSTELDGQGAPRRFDQGMLVDNEIVGEFLKQSFFDPNDDRVMDELLQREIGGGLKVSDIISRGDLRKKLLEQQEDKTPEFVPVNVQPQRHRVEARKRLNERSKSVAARILEDLSLAPVGREIGTTVKNVSGRDNLTAAIELMHRKVNDFLGISHGERSEISAPQAEEALSSLDTLGDQIVDDLKGRV